MRWRGGLGSFLLRDCSLTPCNLSSVPTASASTPHPCSFFGTSHFIPSAAASTSYHRSPWLRRGSGVVVAGFLGGALFFSLYAALQEFPVVSSRVRALGLLLTFCNFSLRSFASTFISCSRSLCLRWVSLSSSLRPSKSFPWSPLGFEPNV